MLACSHYRNVSKQTTRILQDSSKPSNDNTNVVNALQEPFVVKQDPGKNSSQSPPQINHHCCYRCRDPLEDIFFHQCACELCGKEEKQIEDEQAAKARYWKIPISYDDDDDKDCTVAITPKEPDNSLSMGDEHLDTIPTTESDEFIKS
nr:hypothetical protein [Tanacetum cinerariifolium]